MTVNVFFADGTDVRDDLRRYAYQTLAGDAPLRRNTPTGADWWLKDPPDDPSGGGLTHE